MEPSREPLFNTPPVVGWTIAALVAIHVARSLVLGPAETDRLLELFAFIPARYDPAVSEAFRGGLAADIWTFVTYAGLHGDYMHLGVNCIWLLAFGSAVAWRFGAKRFLAFMAATAAAGAATHLIMHFGEPNPMIGASGAISGLTAAAVRFVFEAGGPLGAFRRRGRAAFAVPAVPLIDVFRSPQIMVFVGIWFGINLLYALTAWIGGGASPVAWEAHIGGFIAGLVLFRLFDPRLPFGVFELRRRA
ncbi:rhomboid family intramembrane serine protease [Terrihabitans soli]|uniref:rhomboid family intramembrane serine protease n=1 Tax=Terrihabitans soli TaxID=708113 RepID=UPI001CA34143|nr:rhomboid family intramembrane serine protease [Terrihabitans soli]